MTSVREQYIGRKFSEPIKFILCTLYTELRKSTKSNTPKTNILTELIDCINKYVFRIQVTYTNEMFEKFVIYKFYGRTRIYSIFLIILQVISFPQKNQRQVSFGVFFVFRNFKLFRKHQSTRSIYII